MRGAREATVGRLTNARLAGLAARHGTPLLVIDCEAIRRQYRSLSAALPGVGLFYALKPLPDAAVVATLRKQLIDAPGGRILRLSAEDREVVALGHELMLLRRFYELEVGTVPVPTGRLDDAKTPLIYAGVPATTRHDQHAGKSGEHQGVGGGLGGWVSQHRRHGDHQ
jgi:hypothetical protein